MEWILVPAAYLAGSISFSVLLVRLLQDRDVRRLGSGNAGATNVLRVAGRRLRSWYSCWMSRRGPCR